MCPAFMKTWDGPCFSLNPDLVPRLFQGKAFNKFYRQNAAKTPFVKKREFSFQRVTGLKC